MDQQSVSFDQTYDILPVSLMHHKGFSLEVKILLYEKICYHMLFMLLTILS